MIGLVRGGELVAKIALDKRAQIQVGKVLGRDKSFAALHAKIFANRIKVDELREAFAAGMNVQRGLTRRQRKVLFMRDPFISGQNKHSAVTGSAKLLQRLESAGRKSDCSGGKPGAVLLQEAVPYIVWVMLGRDGGGLIGKPQVFKRLDLAIRCRRSGHQEFLDFAALDRECI